MLPRNNPRDIVVATNNVGKIREIQEILKNFSCHILPIRTLQKDFFVEEDGQTYEENAIKKARHAAVVTGKIAIADDSGLEVDVLEGAPGIYSARFGGEHLPFSEKNTLLLKKLAGITERSARFRCIIAIVSPNGKTVTTEGVCEGTIGTEPRGTFGFGFDPIFILPEYQKTMAELEPNVKNMISHRAKALKPLPDLIIPFLKSTL